ncbi:uncharacterized protein LOC123534018 [Mercenaria mercenaria]|uniref:uncharacterized protein LOC123534018 n=1 Tax=Mercenaria mercenaria TaxID=6596 RepID=UPI00234F1168|nr:uncharacterized protein LOC123534018 [Mercenaria mercenaria]
MDSDDPWTESLRNLPEVPRERRIRKRKNGNSVKETSTRYQKDANDIDTADQKLLEIKMKLAESADTVGGNEARDFARFDELFSRDLPCTLLYLDRYSSSLKPLKTIDELSECIKTADKSQTIDVRIVKTLESAPVGRLVHFAKLGKYLRYLYRNNRLLDVRIEVDGAVFMAHRVALCYHSGYLRNLLVKKQKLVKIPVHVKIVGVSSEAFLAFLEYVYTGEVHVHSGIVADIFHMSEYLDVKLLRDKLASLECDFTLEESIKLLLKRPRELSEKPYNVAFAQILGRFVTASMSIRFLDLDVEIFCNLLKSDALRVSHEFEAFQVAIRWIVHGGRERVPYITRVMNNIRFCHMSPYELFDCLEETSLFHDRSELRELLLIANWVITAMRLEVPDPFRFVIPPYRDSYKRVCKKTFSKQDKNQRPIHSTKRPMRLPAQEDPEDLETLQPTIYPTSDLQPPAEPLSATPKKSSPRYGKPVLVDQDQMIADFSRWCSSELVLPPPETQRSSRNTSPKYGKPVVLPPEIQRPELHFSEPKSETKSVQRPTISPASHRKPTIWSPTPSNESSPSNSAVLFPPGQWSMNEPAVPSLEVHENISNHSPRHERPLSRDEQAQRPSKPNKEVVQLPMLSPNGRAKPTIWSPAANEESPNDSPEGTQNFVRPQSKPIQLLNQLREFLKTEVVHRPAVSPPRHVTPNSWSSDSNKGSSLSTSPRYSETVLLPPEETEGNERPKLETECVCQARTTTAVQVKPICSPNFNQCSNPKTSDIEEASASIEYNPSRTGRFEDAMKSTAKLQASETQLNYKASGVLQISRRETDDISQSSKTRHQYERYVVSETLARRTAKPVMSPPEVDVVPDMSKQLPVTDIIIVGCFDDSMASTKDRNDGYKNWADFCNLPEPRYGFTVARVGRKLYVIGGSSPAQTEAGSRVTNSVLQMDCIDKKWQHVAPMKEARMCHSACVLDDNIYVFGGLGADESPLASCECYCTSTNTWSTITPMSFPIYAGSAAGFGGRCYIAGGLTRTADDVGPRLRMTMVCFDPKKRTWSVPGYLRMPLCHASLVSTQGRLLLCGGATYHDDRARRKRLVSVANIDEYNILTNSWRFLTKMSTPRQEPSVVALGSKLFVIGGKKAADDTILQSVECYDTIASAWKKCLMELPPSVRWIKCVSCQNIK